LPSNGEILIAQLRAEFVDVAEESILLLENPPAVFSAPSVVVTPGDPFLEPETLGLIRENWDILVVVAMKDKGLGIEQLRDISLRVRRATIGAGAVWRRASGPRKPQGEDAKALVLSVNEIDFKTTPS
jgi:hypothetical protein